MFDPYHKWLGIKPGPRSPTYYQLLGIEPDEQDPEVIEEAAVRQTTHLRAYQIGAHADDCTRLLNEISQARNVLLNPAKRKAYDAALAQHSSKIRKAPPPVPAASAFGDLEAAPHTAVDITRQQHGKRGRQQGGKTKILLAIAAGGLIPIAVALFLILSPKEATPPTVHSSDHQVAVLKKPEPSQPNPETRPIPRPVTTAVPQPVINPNPPPKVDPNPPAVVPNPPPKVDLNPPPVVPNPPPKVEPPPAPPVVPGGEPERLAATRQIKLDGPVAAVAFSPDGRRILAGGSRASLWDVETGQRLHQWGEPKSGIIAATVAFVPDGSRAVSAAISEQVIHLWDVTTGQELGQFAGHTSIVVCAAVSPDGRRLISGSHDSSWRVWDIATQKELGQLGGRARPCGVVFLPDGRALTADHANLQLWQVSTHQLLQKAATPLVLERGLAISGDGRLAVTAHADHVIRLWDVKTLQCIRQFQASSGALRAVALSADGRFIATGSGAFKPVDGKSRWVDTVVRVWDAATGKQLKAGEGHTTMVNAVAISPDGRYVLSGATDQTLRLWPLAAAKAVVVKPVNPPPEVKEPIVVKPPPPEVKEPVVVKPAEQPRAAVPDAAKLTQAEKTVHELFEKEYAHKAPADKLALADKLLDKAQQTRDDLPGRFVLLREARDLAAQAGDAAKAFRAIEELDKAYTIDALETKTAALTLAGNAPLTATTGRDVAELALATIDNALAADNFAAADQLVAAAERVARKTQPKVFLVQVQRRERLVREVQKEYEKVKGLADTLARDPDNAEANLVTGQYLCCRKGEWDKGLPLLARGRDDALKALAQKDLARPKEAPAQVELGDGWWDRGQKEATTLKAALQVRSAYWYRQALPGLTGLTLARVEQRVKQVEEQQGPAHLADNLGEIRRFKGHFGAVTCVTFSADGKWALSGGVDGTVRVWEVASGTLIRRCAGQAGPITSVAIFAPNKFTALSTSKDGTTFVWDLRTARVLYKPGIPRTDQRIQGAAFSADGLSVMTINHQGQLWRFNLERRSGSGGPQRTEEVRGMAVTPDWRLLAVNEANGDVRLYNASVAFMSTGTLAGTPQALGVAVSPDGTQVLTAGADNLVRLWNAQTRQEVRACTGHTGRVRCVAFSADGQRALSGGEDKTVRLWDLNTGRELRRFALHTGTVLSVACSPDGRQALSASTDSTIRLWSLPR